MGLYPGFATHISSVYTQYMYLLFIKIYFRKIMIEAEILRIFQLRINPRLRC